jgi:serine/threonine protein phosphatase PrpC
MEVDVLSPQLPTLSVISEQNGDSFALRRTVGDMSMADDLGDNDVPDLAPDEEVDEPTRGGGAAVRRIQLDAEIDAIEDEPTCRHVPLELRAGGRTDEGTRRTNNEDAMLILEKSSLYAVADGMGGHAGGEIASQLAIEAIASTFLDKSDAPSDVSNIPQSAVELMQSFAAANEAIRSMATRTPYLSEMGTTVVAALFSPESGRVYIAHVGDSRCYRLRDGRLEQITTDHTLAEMGVTGRKAHCLSRAVGTHGIVEVDIEVLELRKGDVFLLCSDGITKALDDDLILEILQREDDPEDAAWGLIARANALRARDNVTALVISVSEPADADRTAFNH